MPNGKPTCGVQAVPTDSTLDAIIAVLGFLFGIPSTIAGIVEVIEMTEVITLGVAGATNLWIAAAAAAVATLAIIVVFWHQRCADRKGPRGCAAGVVNEIEESFSSTADQFFPFVAMHDRVDVVVKSAYWPLVETNAAFIKCTDHVDPDEQSPILQSFFENPEVCAAGLGAVIGGAVGAVGGIIAGVAIAAAIACAGPWIIICLIIAAIVAVIVVLVGAAIGGQIGKAIAEGGPPQADGRTISVGDYVTNLGILVVHGDFEGAVVFWFVTEASFHGTSSEPGPDFVFTDPDANLVPDACG